MSLLTVDNLHIAHNAHCAVSGLSFSLAAGECLAILGANGAGKTTLLRALAGLLPVQSGSVRLAGEEIGGLPSHQIAARGLALVPEERQVFTKHTVLENLELGAYRLLRSGEKTKFQQRLEEVCTIFPVIRERIAQPAGQLSGGEQQMVAIARALMSQPRLLLLDEPSLGLSPKLAGEFFRVLDQLRTSGLTVLLAEQMTTLALKHSHRAVVLQRGRMVLQGNSSELQAEPRLLHAYLGAESFADQSVPNSPSAPPVSTLDA